MRIGSKRMCLDNVKVPVSNMIKDAANKEAGIELVSSQTI